MTYTPTFELRLQILKSQRSTKGRREGGVPSSRFPCCVLSYFSLVFVMEHNWQNQVIRVSWVGQSTNSRSDTSCRRVGWLIGLFIQIAGWDELDRQTWKVLAGWQKLCGGAKWSKKGLELAFLDQIYLFLVNFFLSGIGGYPPPPLNGKSLCSKKLSGKGGYPHPLTENIR